MQILLIDLMHSKTSLTGFMCWLKFGFKKMNWSNPYV